MFGLDNTIITFIARSEAAGNRARSRSLFHLGVALAVMQSAFVAALSIIVVRFAGNRFNLNPQMIAVLSVMLCAMPGVALYRICTAVSRGMKVMKHDIFSRGLTESTVTTAAFLVTFALGWNTFGPPIAAIIGTGASGLVALFLASSLFRSGPHASEAISYRDTARQLLSYAASISGYDLLNALIVRVDVITLALFIGRAPGVTLVTVGIYGVVVEVASGLRKVNQAFNPIFAPMIAGMTAHGEQEHAAKTFSRVAQWMLWILLPLLAVIALAGSVILSIYGPEFREGAIWLDIVAIACGTNCFVGLAETVIMVQRPRLNLLNSAITCVIALAANFWLIGKFGVIGAAFGILVPYVVLGILRHRTLQRVFGWRKPWSDVSPPILAALLAIVPAIVCRVTIPGIAGQIIAAAVFLLLYFAAWKYYHAQERPFLEML